MSRTYKEQLNNKINNPITKQRLEQTFHQRRCTNGIIVHMKKYSTWVVTRETKTEITMSYHLLTEKLQSRRIPRMWGNGNLCAPLMDCKMVQPLWKTVRQFPKMLNINLPYDPANLLPSIYQREMKICVLSKLVHKCSLAIV